MVPVGVVVEVQVVVLEALVAPGCSDPYSDYYTLKAKIINC